MGRSHFETDPLGKHHPNAPPGSPLARLRFTLTEPKSPQVQVEGAEKLTLKIPPQKKTKNKKQLWAQRPP